MTDLLEWLEGSGLGGLARESLYGFQALVGIHILGLVFSFGMLLWVDLRMLGVCVTGRRLSAVYGAFARWFVGGFAVMISSGVALFAGFATSAYENTYFRIKMLVIVLAGVNALAFHVVLGRLPALADEGVPPAIVRLAGALSIVFWITAILCGRMMSYTLF